MKKITFSFKSLLLAAGLLLGSANAWADKEYTTLYSNDYENAAKISDIRSGDYKDCQIEVSTNHYLKIRENGRNGGNGSMTFPSYSTDDYQEYILSFKMGFYTSNNKGSSFQIKSGSTSLATFGWGSWSSDVVSYTIGSTVQSETLSAVYQSSGTRNSDTSNSITTWYTFTITGSEENDNVTLTVNDGSSDVISNSIISNSYVAVSGFYFTLGSAHAEIGFDDMLLRAYSETEVVPNPSATITGAYNSTRTVTMNLGTGSKEGTVIKYYTDTESKSDLTTYTEPFVVSSNSTIYYYAESTSSAKSEEQNIVVTCEPIQLVSPFMSGITLNANGDYQTPTYTFANGDNSGLIGSPSATLTATFNDVPLLGFTGTFTPTQDGTLVVTSSADGYTSSQISVDCYVYYAQFWQSVDYSTLSEAEMTASYPTWTKSESGRWASWKETGSNYTYYSVTDGEEGNANFIFDTYFRIRRNLSSLVEGFGIGRNTSGGETLTVTDATDNDIIALKIYNGYGNSAAADANYTVYSLRNGANVTYSLSNGKLLMQGTIYRPLATVSATIGSTGWTTFASSYPLDLSSMTASAGEVAAYYASSSDGDKVTMLPTDATVAAGEGLMLKGTPEAVITIPVAATGDDIDGNKLVGCPTETVLAANADNYVLVSNAGTAEFQSLEDNGATIPAGKAYLNLTANPVKAFRIAIVDGTATGVEAPVAAEAVEEDGVLYNTSGQQVTADYKGIVIKNGKKYFNK